MLNIQAVRSFLFEGGALGGWYLGQELAQGNIAMLLPLLSLGRHSPEAENRLKQENPVSVEGFPSLIAIIVEQRQQRGGAEFTLFIPPVCKLFII